MVAVAWRTHAWTSSTMAHWQMADGVPALSLFHVSVPCVDSDHARLVLCDLRGLRRAG